MSRKIIDTKLAFRRLCLMLCDMAVIIASSALGLLLNGDSLIGGFLDSEAAYNRKLLNNDLVHFIASDSHNDKTRAPMMRKSIDYLRKKCDMSKLNKITLMNPSKILEDTYI
mgnify:CR=1 FL=1